MEKGRKEAIIGLESEREIVHMINNDSQFQKRIKTCFSRLGFKTKEKLEAYGEGVKTDIFIKINDSAIGVSIKSSTRTSFHQLDRRKLEVWKSLLNMPDLVFKILKEAILRIAYDEQAKFILERDRDKIAGFFKMNIRNILEEIFVKGEQHLELLMINDKVKRKVYLFKMKDLLSSLSESSGNVRFSKKGIVKLGDFITVQRKSGNGKHVRIPKMDWNHPGNELQFKFSPLKFAEFIDNTKIIDFCEIGY